jgi:hypothetical protein
VLGQVLEDSQRPGGIGAPITDEHGFLDAAHVRVSASSFDPLGQDCANTLTFQLFSSRKIEATIYYHKLSRDRR